MKICRILAKNRFPFFYLSVLLAIGFSFILWTTSSLNMLIYIPFTIIASLVVGLRFSMFNRMINLNTWNRSMKLIAFLAYVGVFIIAAGGYAKCVASNLGWARYGEHVVLSAFGGAWMNAGPIQEPSKMELVYSMLGNIMFWGGILISISCIAFIRRFRRIGK